MTQTIAHPHNQEPVVFTREKLDWLSWLPPLAIEDLTERHYAGLVDASRAKSEYFRLLAHDPDVLGARTRTDKDIFYNSKGGLPRAAREIAATTVSRSNGCIFCASVHAGFAVVFSKREADVDALLAEGTSAPIDGLWGQVIATAEALTATPNGLGVEDLGALYDSGLDDLAVLDLIQSTAFFNWANRLMLSLGEPAQGAAAQNTATGDPLA